jgi:quinol---cytochrome c reductase iron-sulfur subunit, bacillus type
MNPNEPLADSSTESAAEQAPRLAEGQSRRTFLFKLAVGVNAAVGAALAVPVIGFLLGPALGKRANQYAWVHLGRVEEFPEGQVRLANFRNPTTTPWDGETGNIPCWVRHISAGRFQVFAINCAHLGCPVRWFAQSRLFLCPCHGGVYYEDGTRASGPPPRGLFQYAHKVSAGNLMIYAGKMPTLAAPGAQPPLTQIESSPAAAAGARNASPAKDAHGRDA